jgi:hypothetical protein
MSVSRADLLRILQAAGFTNHTLAKLSMAELVRECIFTMQRRTSFLVDLRSTWAQRERCERALENSKGQLPRLVRFEDVEKRAWERT